MPAQRVDYVPQPFVGDRYRDSGYGRSLADLMLQRGNQAAALHLQRGDNAARMWQGAGNAINQAVQGWQQSVELNRQRALEAARESRYAESAGLQTEAARMALDDRKRQRKAEDFTRQILPLARREDGLATYDRSILQREFEAAGMADALPDVFAKLDEQDAAHFKLLQTKREVVSMDALRVLQGGGDADAFDGLLQYWEANDVLPSKELAVMRKAAKDPQGRQQALLAAVQSSPAGVQMLQKMREATAPEFGELDPTKTLYNKRTGEVLREGQQKPPTSFEDAILARMPDATPEQLIAIKKEIAAAGRPPAAPRNEPLVAVIGPDGKAVMVPQSEAVGKQPANVREQTSTGVQKRVFQFFQRAQQAENDVMDLEDSVAALDLGGQTWLKYAPNFLQTDKGQLYNQAQRAFTEARLRKDSGAAIPPHEYEADRKTYFAEPGDSKETLAQKRRARANVLRALAFESGRAVSEFYGEDADALLSDLAARSGDAKGTSTAGGGAGDGWQDVGGGFKVRVKP